MSLFKKRDPICGMKEIKGQGVADELGNWFCCTKCKDVYHKKVNDYEKKIKKSGRACCQ